jgi:AcrR family transcriptional regulator
VVDGRAAGAQKEQTRTAIQRAALRLIAENGYAATTCEEIAAAAEGSPATPYRYFPTKEDIVLQDGYDPVIAAAVLSRPAGEPSVVVPPDHEGRDRRRLDATRALRREVMTI